jgi:di/tricarboxylate transporter
LPTLPSLHALAVIVLIGVALYMFAKDRWPLQTTGFAVLLVLALGFYVFPYPGIRTADFFANFGNEALVTVCALLVLVKGLETTGALQPLTSFLGRLWDKGPRRAMLITLVLAAAFSGFINDTPLMAILFPVLLACANRSKTAPSQVLLPLNYAVLIGGAATTIGTSTNLLAVGVAEDLGLGPFKLFDLAPPVLFAGGLGLVFVWLAGPYLLPERRPMQAGAAPRIFSAAFYVNEGGFAHGRTVSEVLARTQNRMRIERIQRGDDLTIAKLPSLKLQAGDRLYVKDTPDRLKEFENILGATMYDDSEFETPVTRAGPLTTEGQQLAEVVITRASPLYQRVLNASEFVARYRLLPLAIHRGRATDLMGAGETEEVRLRAGDVILVQGAARDIKDLRASGSMLVLDGTVDLPHTDRATLALLIMAGVVVSNATGLMPISIGALMGIAAMLLTRCLRWRHITEALNINLVMVIVSSLSLGLALTKTGAADFVAQLFVWVTQALPVPLVMASIMLAITVLTNVVTNNAAVVIGVPIAISVARQLGAPPEAFVLAVIYGANMPFSTPIGYQTNTMIMNAGGYRFADYVRFGVPLTAVMLPAFTVILTILYDL